MNRCRSPSEPDVVPVSYQHPRDNADGRDDESVSTMVWPIVPEFPLERDVRLLLVHLT